MNALQRGLTLLLITIAAWGCSDTQQKPEGTAQELKPAPFEELEIEGRLMDRAARNYGRLEETKYQPDNLYITNIKDANWPGDTEGRTILALTLLEQATHRPPTYLEEILNRYPSELNSKGYLGTVYPEGVINEQQLSGHGWLMRALAERYIAKNDSAAKEWLQDIVDSLVLPTAGYHDKYPLDPAEREDAGSYSGTHLKKIGNWIVSTDIGCDLIFMDGVVHAYDVLGDERLVPIIEEMVRLYNRIDMREIKAQTHAMLTGSRAMVRYYELTGREELLAPVIEKFEIYKNYGMSENYENWNWFGRPEWTEPCAVIDSYVLAVKLWRHTGNPGYLEDAHLIYYNGIGHDQRANGGFGLSNVTGSSDPFLRVQLQEAHWCCTMRGGEGIARMAQYSWFTHGDTLIFPFFNEFIGRVTIGEADMLIDTQSNYPFEGHFVLRVERMLDERDVVIKFFAPSWTTNNKVYQKGEEESVDRVGNFIVWEGSLHRNSTLVYRFEQELRAEPTHNKESIEGYYKVLYGPLLLGAPAKEELQLSGIDVLQREDAPEPLFAADGFALKPILHLMDPEVKKGDAYQMQILFKKN